MSSESAFGELEELADLFRKLASPIRLAIIMQLAKGAKCVHELVEELDQSQPLISQHLRILREANLVIAGRRGREMVYHLMDDHVAHIVHDGYHHTLEDHT
ncbi:MAG: metalloregulator ArsR/SmtB family transcription factor [Bowdeniella nasicola]|nr:metalloregulator ArsR/SmtB family transcription factor [Bowdeniella nasicola]